MIIPINAYGQKKERPKRCKQARLPKKPRFEPRNQIIPGNHQVIFEKASEIKNANL